MILCKSTKRKFVDQQRRITSLIRGRRRFAFLPTKIITGEWILFESYAQYSIGIEIKTPGKPTSYKLATRNDLPDGQPRRINTLSMSTGPFLQRGDQIVSVKEWVIETPSEYRD